MTKYTEIQKEDEMANAFIKLDPNLRIGSMKPSGIKLKATIISTRKPASSGVQLNNTTMEIEVAPDIKVEVVGSVKACKYHDRLVEALRLMVEVRNGGKLLTNQRKAEIDNILSELDKDGEE
jgi:hypothetical protein